MQQLNLFAESTPVLPITYYPDFLGTEQANQLYQHCLKLEWQQNQIRIAGKTMPVPRLECLYGDKGCDYLYSNSVFLKPLWWTEALSSLRDSITALTGYKFRIVIGNQYRMGTDSIRWHADKEPSMGFHQPGVMSQIPNQAHRRQTNRFLAGTRQLTRDAPRLSINTSASSSENKQSR